METIKSSTTLCDDTENSNATQTENDDFDFSTINNDNNRQIAANRANNSGVNSKFELLRHNRNQITEPQSINQTKNRQSPTLSGSQSSDSILDRSSNVSDSDTLPKDSRNHEKDLNQKIYTNNGDNNRLLSPISSVRSHSPNLKSSLKHGYVYSPINNVIEQDSNRQMSPQSPRFNSNNNSITSTGSLRGNKVIFIDHNEPSSSIRQTNMFKHKDKDKDSNDDTNSRGKSRIIHRFEIEPSAEEIKPSLENDNYKESILLLEKQRENEDGEDKKDPSEKTSKAIKLRYNEEQRTLEVEIKNDFVSQLSRGSFYKALLAEFIGTFLLVLYICSYGLPISDPSHTNVPASINGALGTGVMVSAIIWCLGHLSGANINPAVTIALFAAGESNIIRAIAYIGMQLCGALFGAFVLKELVPDHLKIVQNLETSDVLSRVVRDLANQTITQNEIIKTALQSPVTSMNTTATVTINAIQKPVYPIGLTLLHPDFTPTQGFGIELISTFILVITAFACLDRKRTDINGSFPLSIGFAAAVGAFFSGPFTGASMNPARSFGPAVIMNVWDNHWIYWLGPITGGLIAALVYKCLSYNPKQRSIKARETKI